MKQLRRVKNLSRPTRSVQGSALIAMGRPPATSQIALVALPLVIELNEVSAMAEQFIAVRFEVPDDDGNTKRNRRNARHDPCTVAARGGCRPAKRGQVDVV